MRDASAFTAMTRRAHMTWRLVALLALVVAAAWPRERAIRREAMAPAHVELLSASMSSAPEIDADR